MTYVALLDASNEELIQGNVCLTSMVELYQALLQKDLTELIISDEFAKEYFTPSGLGDFIESAKTVRPYIHITVSKVLGQIELQKVQKLKDITCPEEFIFLLERYPDEVMSLIGSLCNAYTGTKSETLIANSKVANLQLLNAKLQTQLKELTEQYEHALVVSNEAQAKLHSLVSRINYTYMKPANVDMHYDMVSNRYTYIIYVKEVSKVRYVDTLLYYLAEILRTAYNSSVRTLVIEPHYCFGQEALYPGFIPHWKLSYSDVYNSDILMVGYQNSLMEDILRNPANTDYLIVLDRSKLDTPCITGPAIINLCTMSELQDNIVQADKSDIISYATDTLCIPHIGNFKETSDEYKISQYSSMPIVKEILRRLEG